MLASIRGQKPANTNKDVYKKQHDHSFAKIAPKECFVVFDSLFQNVLTKIFPDVFVVVGEL